MGRLLVYSMITVMTEMLSGVMVVIKDSLNSVTNAPLSVRYPHSILLIFNTLNTHFVDSSYSVGAPCVPEHGDGFVLDPEQCDDGNVIDGMKERSTN